ncbi:MAG: SRPBCC domain-containing protein [Cellulomonadaceae bacterium]|jgi:uncharacterized protein YndB with AHSA1/START domain|nr:SRPBCC domain-containing protein [Cellulomonadaceae bacterium]
MSANDTDVTGSTTAYPEQHTEEHGGPHTVTVSTLVTQPPQRVWAEMLHPGARWMLGANIESDFQPGSTVTFEGHFFGRRFEDHGTIVAFDRPKLMHFTHYSPLYGLPDEPVNYHEIRITLEEIETGTRIVVVQENIATADRADRAADQWKHALASLAHSDHNAHADITHQ